MRKFLLNGSLVVCSLLLSLLMGEAMVRRWAPRETCVPWQDELNGVSCPRPNVRGRCAIPGIYEGRLTINSQRFRSTKEFTSIPQSGAFRIVTLGDSFTHGVGASDDQCYPARLERGLNASGLKTEILNAGTNGTGTSDQALFYDRWVSRFRPHLVILNIWVNDIDEDLARGLFTVDPKGGVAPRPMETIRAADNRIRIMRRLANVLPAYSYLAQYSQLIGFLRTSTTALMNEMRVGPLNSQRRRPTFDTDLTRWSRDGVPLLVGEIAWLNRRIQRDGAKMVVIFIPPRESIYPLRFTSAVWRKKAEIMQSALREFTDKASIPFFDLTPVLQERAVKVSLPLYYEIGDFHATPAGYAVFGAAVTDFLIGKQLVPSQRVAYIE